MLMIQKKKILFFVFVFGGRFLSALSTPYPSTLVLVGGSSYATLRGDWAGTNTSASDIFPLSFLPPVSFISLILMPHMHAFSS